MPTHRTRQIAAENGGFARLLAYGHFSITLTYGRLGYVELICLQRMALIFKA